MRRRLTTKGAKMSVSPSTRLRALVLAAACAATLGLAACGGGDDTSTTATSTAATSSTTTSSDTGGVSSDIRQQFDDAVRQSLEAAAANGAPIDVDCAVSKLEAALSDDDVQQIVDAFQNGQQPPSSIQQDITSVATECVKQ
jgi:basic membrane lipoprotein Med (substrate-binding protein (PBP1-ABC) superfamily)